MFHKYTKVEELRRVLSDGAWHATGELVRRVGHSFGVAVFHLRRDYARRCEVTCERHPTKPNQFRYRMTTYATPEAKR